MRLDRFLLLGVFLLSGCVPILFDDSCGPTTRETAVGGEIRDGNRNEPDAGSFGAGIAGPASGNRSPLSGHVQRVRLVAADGAVLREISFRTPVYDNQVILAGEQSPVGREEADRMRRLFRASGVALQIESDVPGLERISVPLRLAQEHDWSRGHCS
jgi:hypothetical protein